MHLTGKVHESMNGFINVLKPPGMSSAAVVGFVKRMTKEKHVGHAGTLDPEAAGVLPVMIGRATRLFDYLVDKEKNYVAECAFGASTDTQDAQGTVLETGDQYPDLDTVRRACLQLTGDILQRPSMYSAIKVGGKPLYARARRGEEVEVPERTVHIEHIEVMGEMADHGVLLRVDCGRGTYIRSVCDDLGRLTGCPAHMRFLLRTRSGAFTIEQAMTLEEMAAFAEAGTLAEHLLPLDLPLQHLPELSLPMKMQKQALNGVRFPAPPEITEGQNVRTSLGNRFLGITRREGQEMVWKVLILPEPGEFEPRK